MQQPYLTAEEEHALAIKNEQGCILSARQLIISHLRHVIITAKKYSGYHLNEADLIQEGTIGLMKAVKRFKASVGVRLSTFSIHWIKAEITDFILAYSKTTKIATTKDQRKLFFNLRKLKNKHADGQWLTQAQAQTIAEELNVKVKEVNTMEGRLYNQELFIDHNITQNHEESTIELADDDSCMAEAYSDEKSQRQRTQQLHHALSSLSSREADIVQQRWISEVKTPLRTLALKYDVSIERIRQLENMAIDRLKHLLTT
jgi:RNA polymerase sigma-32 factor